MVGDFKCASGSRPMMMNLRARRKHEAFGTELIRHRIAVAAPVISRFSNPIVTSIASIARGSRHNKSTRLAMDLFRGRQNFAASQSALSPSAKAMRYPRLEFRLRLAPGCRRKLQQ
jgi:hypothetical protein